MPSPSANHLPVQHPEFRYPESKNPYWAKAQAVRRPGLFRQRDRNPSRPLARDVSRIARFQAQRASRRNRLQRRPCRPRMGSPQSRNGYVGIDWKFKPIFWGIEKALKRTIANLLFFRAHAERLPFMFGEGEIDFLYLFFPDPWPQKKQWKNRFLTARNAGSPRAGGEKRRDLSHQDGSPGIFRVDARALAQCERENRKALGSRGRNARPARGKSQARQNFRSRT